MGFLVVAPAAAFLAPAPSPAPAILVTAGLYDPRVAYWEPAKWVARLRAMSTSDAPTLLKMDLDSGHFSASDRYKYLEQLAFEYAFVLDQLGLREDATC